MTDVRPWFQLSPEELVALPVDELALRILVQIGEGSENWGNAIGRIAAQDPPRAAKQAVVEAWWWLVRKGLIAPDAQNPADERFWLATRLGREVAARSDGLARARAGERLDVDLHPRIADDVRAEFLRGKFETAVWVAMREVEIALREASGADAEKIGVQLVNYAFAQGKGP